MINGLGVVGWGVGGIEAEAVMLGQPLYMLMPEVVGFELTGQLPPGATATDLVLTVTEMLRKAGRGRQVCRVLRRRASPTMSLADRATIANMAPEYGATMGFFPGRCRNARLSAAHRPHRRAKWNWSSATPRSKGCSAPTTRRSRSTPSTLSLDLGHGRAVPGRAEATAGSRAAVADEAIVSSSRCERRSNERGFALDEAAIQRTATVARQWTIHAKIGHGAVVIAAITSCTNTSNPSVMLAAGLLAKKAVEKGLTVQPYVKTSLAPGSRVVTDYLRKGGLDAIPRSNSAFTPSATAARPASATADRCPNRSRKAVQSRAIWSRPPCLSGNRNFEGRINPLVKANYLASPPLVVAYALAGTTDIDLTTEPLGTGQRRQATSISRTSGRPQQEVASAIEQSVSAGDVSPHSTAMPSTSNEQWNAIKVTGGRPVRLGSRQARTSRSRRSWST